MKTVIAAWVASFLMIGSVLFASYLDINTDFKEPIAFFFIGGVPWGISGFLSGKYGDK